MKEDNPLVSNPEVFGFNPRLVLESELHNVEGPGVLYPLVANYMKDLPNEQIVVVALDKDLNLLGGGLWALADGDNGKVGTDYSLVAEWLKEKGAVKVVFAHNHPKEEKAEMAGLENVNPSSEDVASAGYVSLFMHEHGIEVMDNIIIGHHGDVVSIDETVQHVIEGMSRLKREMELRALRKIIGEIKDDPRMH